MSFPAVLAPHAMTTPAQSVPAPGPVRIKTDTHQLTLQFNVLLTVPAATRDGMDTWLVEVQASGSQGAQAAFEHRTPRGYHPRPYMVLASVASDLQLAAQMPRAIGPALDWLFNEGYATMPSDALAMRQKLVTVASGAEMILEGSGISLAEFTDHILSLSLPRRAALVPSL